MLQKGILIGLLSVPAVLLLVWKGEWFPLRNAAPSPWPSAIVWKTWTDGSWTKEFEQAFTDRLGGRNIGIRVRNTLDYVVFGKLHAHSVVEGKNGSLVEWEYIQTARGEDFMGERRLDSTAQAVAALQRRLESDGKHLLVVLAPGKGVFASQDWLPQWGQPTTPDATNVGVFAKALEKKGVLVYNAHQHFLAQRDTAKRVLMARGGIHWSTLGMWRETKGILSMMEKRMGRPLPQPSWTRAQATQSARGSDDDLLQGTNRFGFTNKETLHYPEVAWSTMPPGTKKPKVVVISDSFYWQMHNEGVTRTAFREGEFWYYNARIYSEKDKGKPITPKEVERVLQEADVFILLSTDVNIKRFGFGFVGQALR